MKIAFVSPDGLSIVLFCKGIIRTLKSIKGAEVFILSADGVYKKEIEDLGVKSITVDMYRFFNPVKDFKYLINLYQIFKKEQFDIVINFTTKPNIYGTLAAKVARINKIILHVVGLGSTFLPASSIKGTLIRYIFIKLYRISCKFSNKIWFTNKNDLSYFLSEGMVSQHNTVLTKNYLDTDEYSPSMFSKDDLLVLRKELGIMNTDKVVVMVARMIWPKGIKEFAETAELLKESNPNLKFLLVAPLEHGNAYAVPESYIKEKEKTSNLKWLGFRSDVKKIYALSDLAVLPSYYKEGGYPRALLEPMAMGKPIITTDTPDCKGTIEEGKNGYLVPPRDSKSLAEVVKKLISNEGKCKELGEYSRKKAEREFDEKRIVPQALSELGLLK